jgi:hypothetical protein
METSGREAAIGAAWEEFDGGAFLAELAQLVAVPTSAARSAFPNGARPA